MVQDVTTETAQDTPTQELPPRVRFWLPWHWRNRSPGQNLVEFALIVPLLLLLIFGIIDFARIIHAQVTVTNAARQGVRFAVTGYQEKDGNGVYISRTVSIETRAKSGLTGLPLVETNYHEDFGWYDIRISSSDPITGVPRAGDPGGPSELVLVEVDYNVTMLTPLINAIFPRVQVHAAERAINEEWGAVPSFEHANLPPIPTPLPTLTRPPSRTPTNTPTITRTPTNTPTVTNTPTITSTPTNTPSVTNTPTITSTPSNTSIPTSTNTPVWTPTRTSTPIFTPTRTSTPVFTSTRTPTQLTPTRTSTPVFTVTRTFTPILTSTRTPTQLTPTRTTTPTRTRTSTRTSTPLIPTPIPTITRFLVIESVIARKNDGLDRPLDIQVHFHDDLGNHISGATVTATANSGSGSWSGSLVDIGAGNYRICDVGSFDGNGGGGITVTVTVSKPGYGSASMTVISSSGSFC